MLDTNLADPAFSRKNRPIVIPRHRDLTRRLLFLIAKLAIVSMIAVAVAFAFRDSLSDLQDYSWQVEPAWLALAGALYLMGLVPMALYWRGLLMGLSYEPNLLGVMRAYALGHLAKYVPGKALTLVVRSAVVKRGDDATAPIVATVFLETLTLMAIGGCLAALLLPRILTAHSGYRYMTTIFAVIALLPLLPPVTKRILNWLLRRRLKPEAMQSGPTGVTYSWSLFASGWVASLISWTLMGLSIWATVRSVGANQVSSVSQLDLWIVAAAVPVVAGFLSMIPGGLVVRDGLLILILGPTLGEPTALIVAALVRLDWLVSECLACGILEVVHRTRRQHETLP